MLSRFRRVWLSATLHSVAHQAPLSLGFSRQEFWSGLPCPLSGDLPDPGIKPASHVSCIGRPGFLPLCHLGSPSYPHMWPKTCFYAISWNSGRMHLICFPSFRDHVLSAYFPIAENCCIYLVWFFFLVDSSIEFFWEWSLKIIYTCWRVCLQLILYPKLTFLWLLWKCFLSDIIPSEVMPQIYDWEHMCLPKNRAT